MNPTSEKELRELDAANKRRSHRTCWLLVSALASHCAADENEIIDHLTGYLFDEEEAGRVKAAKRLFTPPPQPHPAYEHMQNLR